MQEYGFMLDKSGIIRRLMFADQHAKQEIADLKGLESPTLSDYACHIHNYVIYKFLLDDEPDITTRNLNELADLSVKKAGKLNSKEKELLDVSKHCGATTSSMTKKVLMFMALQEDMGVKISDQPTAWLETTDELAELIYRLSNNK